MLFRVLKQVNHILFGGLPKALFLPGFQRRWSRELALGDLEDVATGLRTIRPGDLIDLVISETALLRREINIPISAKAELARVV